MAKQEWHSRPRHHNVEARRASRYAKNREAIGGGAEVEEGWNYPGSPPPAFGFDGTETQEERRWPVVKAQVALPHGRTDLRDELAREMREFIDGFLAKHGLDR